VWAGGGGHTSYGAPREAVRFAPRSSNKRIQQTRQALDLVEGIGAQLMRKSVRPNRTP
jgi:hypothetical protein